MTTQATCMCCVLCTQAHTVHSMSPSWMTHKVPLACTCYGGIRGMDWVSSVPVMICQGSPQFFAIAQVEKNSQMEWSMASELHNPMGRNQRELIRGENVRWWRWDLPVQFPLQKHEIETQEKSVRSKEMQESSPRTQLAPQSGMYWLRFAFHACNSNVQHRKLCMPGGIML